MKQYHTLTKNKMLSSISEPSRALEVIPSDTVNIPYPNMVLESATTDSDADYLIDENVNFITLGIKIGDTVLNSDQSTWAIVVGIKDENTLKISENIFTGSPNVYKIYQGTNQGCLLYVGNGDADIVVLTAGNDIVTLQKIRSGFVTPIRVLRVFATGTNCSGIVAVW